MLPKFTSIICFRPYEPCPDDVNSDDAKKKKS